MNRTNLSLSVIIPSFNRSDALPYTLSSLENQSLHPDTFEVIIVDDGSTDGSVELVHKLKSRLPISLRLIQQEQRSGPGAARNRGARSAEGDLLLFWDSDMLADDDTLRLHSASHMQYAAALVAGARRTWMATCGSTFAQAIWHNRFDRDQFHNKVPSIWEAFSANMSIRRDDFDRTGGFDESLWAFEDVDLAYRAQKAGLHLIFSREALGYHNHPMTLDQACGHERHYQRHAAPFLNKHPELEGQIKYLVDKGPVRIGNDPLVLVLRKIMRQLIASRGVLASFKIAISFLEKYYADPQLLSFFYWKILSSYQLIGYREGLEQLAKENKA